MVIADKQLVKKHTDRLIEHEGGKIGSGNESPCTPSWLTSFLEHFEKQEGYELSASALSALCHAMLGQEIRVARLAATIKEQQQTIEDLSYELKEERE